ncbi:hypothetical protein RRG08_018502 [Elysia crispata]|uniref:Uncharacterized protein n=1 Tax=Elysia crispata TaxID=231223 RepID=A0AAE0Y2J8_9GAST|nr:hypothetical protein RRG08_018502 [Elysia crispata]
MDGRKQLTLLGNSSLENRHEAWIYCCVRGSNQTLIGRAQGLQQPLWLDRQDCVKPSIVGRASTATLVRRVIRRAERNRALPCMIRGRYMMVCKRVTLMKLIKLILFVQQYTRYTTLHMGDTWWWQTCQGTLVTDTLRTV